MVQLGKLFNVSLDYLLNDETEDNAQAVKPLEAKRESQTENETKSWGLYVSISGGAIAFLGICGIIIFWILSIANPATCTIYKDGKDIVYDGLIGYLKYHNATKLFIACCIIAAIGIIAVIADKIETKRNANKNDD